jgi:hypothetical protein
VRLSERVLVHQVHPAKLAADITASVVSNTLLWRRRPWAAAVTRFAPAVAGSVAVLRLADLDALARTRRGRYVLVHMPPSAQAVRAAGDAVMATGAWRRSWPLMVAGALVVVAGWSHALWPGARPAGRPAPRSPDSPAPRS